MAKWNRIEYHSGEKVGECFYLKDVKSKNQRKALFKCKCGNEFITYIHSVRAGDTKSCGCYQIEQTRKANTTHGMTDHLLFKTWTSIKTRCDNPVDDHYIYYGARGIDICKEWRDDFMNFYNHVIKLPHYKENGRTLDRINNNDDYKPSNMRWATIYEQLGNRRPYGTAKIVLS